MEAMELLLTHHNKHQLLLTVTQLLLVALLAILAHLVLVALCRRTKRQSLLPNWNNLVLQLIYKQLWSLSLRLILCSRKQNCLWVSLCSLWQEGEQ